MGGKSASRRPGRRPKPGLPPRTERLRAILRRQHSIVTRAQLLELGFTRREIERRLESAALVALHRGVYLADALAPPLADEIAAVLACGERSYLSNRSTGQLWSLTPYLPYPERPEVTVLGRTVRRPGIRTYRADFLAPDEVTIFKRIPTTTPARTLLDLAAQLDERQLEQALATALRRHLVRESALHSLLARRSGRPGVPKLRRLLAADAPAFTRSELEEAFLCLVRQAGLPEPALNASLGPYEIDALWRTERLAVELDSWEWHSDRQAFEADRARDAWFVAHGFRVLRFTWRQIREEPVAVAARLAGALAG